MGLIWLLLVVCHLTLLGFVRLKFLCVHKCIWRSQDRSQKVLELINQLLWTLKVHWQWGITRPHRSPPILLTIEPRMFNHFWARSPVSFQHIPLWFPFLNLHITTHHSNKGVRLREVTKLGSLNLNYYWKHYNYSEWNKRLMILCNKTSTSRKWKNGTHFYGIEGIRCHA